MKLTIITINYNNAKGLAKTIESVINQTAQQFEFIVIDGGSTDGSLALISSQPRINHWVSERDNGVYHAMNKGIRAASGEYVQFLNSGDWLYDDQVLERVYPAFNNDTGVVYGNSVFIKEDGYRRENYSPAILSFGHFVHDGLNHQAAFIKRSLFTKYFFYNEQYKMYADWEFFIYVLCAANEPYKYINAFICYYDFSGFSANPAIRAKYEAERQQTFQKYFPLMLTDIQNLEVLRTKRLQQVLHIKKHPFAWRLLKGFMNGLLLFLPKKK
jgi:glycosyltransferase involved in cell wall biosynthesis